jgi:transcription-repair coupling factor (superfamily II helicase)
MSIYRELDHLQTEEQLSAFRSRLEDRFGAIPPQSEELMRIITLRHMAARCGMERVVLKGGKMVCRFVSNPSSPFYQSDTFGHILTHVQQQPPQTCTLTQKDTKLTLTYPHIPSVEAALLRLTPITA